MELTAWLSFLPQLIVAIGVVLGMLVVSWRRSHRLIGHFTCVILVLSLLTTSYVYNIPSIELTLLIKIDSFSKVLWMLVLVAAVVATYLAMGELLSATEVHDEFYILLLLSVLGAGILVASQHYASLFLGFELLSISLVGLTGYFRTRQHSVEASFKYLILSASASSFMLLGIAFIYSNVGTLSFDSSNIVNVNNVVLQLGTLLLFCGLAFKLSLVPFHYWTPDVYQGASNSVTFLLATVSKTAMFAALYKCFVDSGLISSLAGQDIIYVFMFISTASMLVGNCLALGQQSIKRLLAYSSIAHMGYLSILILVLGHPNVMVVHYSAFYYLFAYVLANIGVFSVLCWQKKHLNEETDITRCHWQGLIWRNPWQGSVVLISLLGLAGVPLTAGFIGKFYLVVAASYGQLWWMLSALVIGSGIGLAYYLPLIFALFNDEQYASYSFKTTTMQRLLSLTIIVSVIIFGLFPDIFAKYLLN